MITNTLLSKLFEMTPQGIGKWKKENRPVIELIEKSFSKNELETFLETKEIPYKIKFANEFFSKLNEEFISYIMNNQGIKALMTAIQNESNINEDNLNELVIKQYDNKLISNTDLSDFIKTPPSKDLLLYILDNKKEEWKPFFTSLEEENKWLIDYFKILQLSIEKNIYDLIFSNEYHKIYFRALPKVPNIIINKPKFGKKRSNQTLIEGYQEILTNVKQSIIDGTYHNLQVYDYFEEYRLDIEPSFFQGKPKTIKLIHQFDEDSFSLYEYEASQNNLDGK